MSKKRKKRKTSFELVGLLFLPPHQYHQSFAQTIPNYWWIGQRKRKGDWQLHSWIWCWFLMCGRKMTAPLEKEGNYSLTSELVHPIDSHSTLIIQDKTTTLHWRLLLPSRFPMKYITCMSTSFLFFLCGGRGDQQRKNLEQRRWHSNTLQLLWLAFSCASGT